MDRLLAKSRRSQLQSSGGHSGQASPIESSTSAIATAAACDETPGGGSVRAISNARSRACGSARSCIHPEITECLLVTGNLDYILRIQVKDVDALKTFILTKIKPISCVSETSTMLILEGVSQWTCFRCYHLECAAQSPLPYAGKVKPTRPRCGVPMVSLAVKTSLHP
jgi:DNA-binding Lrp family transcriptional regulator